MNISESNGEIVVFLTPQEHEQLRAADAPNHKDQPAGYALKRKIQDAASLRTHMDGSCRVTFYVEPEPFVPVTTQGETLTAPAVGSTPWFGIVGP